MKGFLIAFLVGVALVGCRPSSPKEEGVAARDVAPPSSGSEAAKGGAAAQPLANPSASSKAVVEPKRDAFPIPVRPKGVVSVNAYAEALAQTKKDGRDLVILFHGSDWNLPGRDFVAQVWTDDRFRKDLGDGFVLLALDHKERKSDEEKAAAKERQKGLKYTVPSYPMLLIVDCEGYRMSAASGDAFPQGRKECVSLVHDIRRAREVRDAWVTKAEAEVDDTVAAQHLFRAWETEVANKAALTKLLDARDPDGKTGWRNRIVFEGRKLTEQAANLAKKGKHDEAMALLQAEEQKPGLTPVQLQWVALAKGNALRYQADQREAAYAALMAAHALDPESLMGKSAYRLAGKFVGPPSLAFGWTNAHCSDGETTWRVEAAGGLDSPGTWELEFRYRRGRSALEIVSVALENGGQVVSSDVHKGSSGHHLDQHLYRVTLKDAPAAPVLLVVCKTDGRKNSEGDLLLKKVDP